MCLRGLPAPSRRLKAGGNPPPVQEKPASVGKRQGTENRTWSTTANRRTLESRSLCREEQRLHIRAHLAKIKLEGLAGWSLDSPRHTPHTSQGNGAKVCQRTTCDAIGHGHLLSNHATREVANVPNAATPQAYSARDDHRPLKRPRQHRIEIYQADLFCCSESPLENELEHVRRATLRLSPLSHKSLQY